MRFVLDPSGAVTPDVAEKLPGRGAWVSADKAAISKAADKGLFARAFKASAKTPDDLPALVERLLEKRLAEGLGLAFRAGAAAIGFDSVRALVQKEAPACLVEAADGAADGRAKILRLANAAHGSVPVYGLFTAAELGAAFGRADLTHAAVRDGPLAARVKRDALRLGGFRPLRPPGWGPPDETEQDKAKAPAT